MTYLFAAYSAIWIILFWYIYRLARRQRQLETGLTQLMQRVSKTSKS